MRTRLNYYPRSLAPTWSKRKTKNPTIVIYIQSEFIIYLLFIFFFFTHKSVWVSNGQAWEILINGKKFCGACVLCPAKGWGTMDRKKKKNDDDESFIIFFFFFKGWKNNGKGRKWVLRKRIDIRYFRLVLWLFHDAQPHWRVKSRDMQSIRHSWRDSYGWWVERANVADAGGQRPAPWISFDRLHTTTL